MKETTLQELVSGLLELNDDNLAKRVIETNDVQWCLSELYDILDADIQEVVRCKDCKHYKIMEKCFRKDGTPIYFCDLDIGILRDNDFCSYGEKREENEN